MSLLSSFCLVASVAASAATAMATVIAEWVASA